jgi:hypothetical protein
MAQTMPETGVRISIIYTDEHLIELRIAASNGVFAGQVDVYADAYAPAECARTLHNFPTSPGDIREFELGDLNTGNAGGGAGFRFYCVDSLGHALAELRLQSDPLRGGGVSDSAVLHIPVEAAAVDEFVEQLGRMAAVVGQAAFLKGAA